MVRGTHNGGFGEISWASPLCQAGTKDLRHLSEGKDVHNGKENGNEYVGYI